MGRFDVTTNRISLDSNAMEWEPAGELFPGYVLDSDDSDAGIFVKPLRRPEDGGGCWHVLLRFRPPTGHDGSFRPGIDRRAARGSDTPYELTGPGRAWLEAIGVVLESGDRRRALGHCVDWTEQRHHLAGRVGAALNDRFFELGWLERGPIRRSVVVTDQGRRLFHDQLGLDA